jgi:hypothetical protein|tara:strand:- start:868 stop:1038 length:171 start_codon:yes stop_codon:yes gene_type:complete
MKVKELIGMLKGFENYDIMVASDEEWNSIFKNIQLEDYGKNKGILVLFGLSGSEVE